MAKTKHDDYAIRQLAELPRTLDGRKVPARKVLERWLLDPKAPVRALDGCKAAREGTCEHGAPSWLAALGLL